jgi:predicted DNA-binding transcriptional regulator YafY
MASLPCDVPLNINISAYRVLFILLMLVRHRSLNSLELNRQLCENPLIGRVFNTETLTKYINTLREVGCLIPRSSSRNDYCYDLLKSPFPLILDPEEHQIAEKLSHLLAHQADEALAQSYQDFLEQLSWLVSNPDPDITEGETAEPVSAELSDTRLEQPLILPALQKRREQMSLYRRFCREAHLLQIKGLNNGQLTTLYLEPHELIHRENRLFLLGYDAEAQQHTSLDIEQVVETRQLPAKNRRLFANVDVVFALYDRLASGYRTYPGEKIIYRAPNEIHVKARILDAKGLMSRLLKYGASCQVLSPESVRDTMKAHVERLLEVLN